MLRVRHKFGRLSPAERRWLLQALVLLPCSAVALRLASFGRLQSALVRLAPVKRGEAASSGELTSQARAIVHMVETASDHGLLRATCLERSLVIWWLLQRRGIAAELRIGVRKDGAWFGAHAWVDLEGTLLGDRNATSQGFAAFKEPILPAERKP